VLRSATGAGRAAALAASLTVVVGVALAGAWGADAGMARVRER
jgi:hypothetical protein